MGRIKEWVIWIDWIRERWTYQRIKRYDGNIWRKGEIERKHEKWKIKRMGRKR